MLSKRLGLSKSELLKRLSSTHLFAALVYHSLRAYAPLATPSVGFVIEPRLVEQSFIELLSFDYAILNLGSRRVLVLSDVKRLTTLKRVGEYLNEFVEKLRRIEHLLRVDIERVVLHFHLAHPLCEREEYVSFVEGMAKLSKAYCSVAVIVTSSCEGSFDEQLQRKISDLLSDLLKGVDRVSQYGRL